MYIQYISNMNKIILAVILSMTIYGQANAGGNSLAAHACNKGGYALLFNQQGQHFSNAGDCVSYASQGSNLLSLAVSSNINPANNTWGQIDAYGLGPNTILKIYGTIDGNNLGEIAAGFVGVDGTVNAGQLGLTCGRNWSNIYATAISEIGVLITSNVANSSCN